MAPMIFTLPEQEGKSDAFEIKLNQVNAPESEQHDTGYVMWPASVILARWLTMNPSILTKGAKQGDILELGAGCGLVGLAAAALLQQQQKNQPIASSEEDESPRLEEPFNSRECTDEKAQIWHLILSDYNPTVLKNLQENIELNNLKQNATVTGLDFFDQSEEDDTAWVDMDGTRRSQVDLILAADILPYSNDSKLVANTIQSALLEGGRALVVSPDETHRFGVEEFPAACREAGLEVEVTNNLLSDVSFDKVNEERREQGDILDGELQKTAGYSNQGYSYYNLRMFSIEKPKITVH